MSGHLGWAAAAVPTARVTALGLGFALLAACVGPLADDSPPPVAHDPITAAEVRSLVTVLASDELAGREAGTPGEWAAAELIIASLEGLPRMQPAGDPGSWRQVFEIAAGASVGGVDDLGPAHNVIALLPGSDPDLADEVIVLGAHYDHVGKGTHGNSLFGVGLIHNGADDNASGSAVLLELARSLATAAQPPRRTILFQWYSGEELGLLGSRHWVAHPTVPFERVVAMLNMDMVGRLTGSTLLVGGTGTSPVWPELIDAALDGRELDVIQDPPGAAPSDNSSFFVQDVPVLFFFTGLHEDYHRPSDDVERLNAVGAARVGRLIEDVLRRLDARDEAPPFTPAPGDATMFTPRPYFGLTFDKAEPWMLGGAVLAVLIPESPGARAGLAEGDVVFKLDGERMLDRKQLLEALKSVDARRSPRQFEVWRAYPGSEPGEDDEWLDSYELISVEVAPEVR